MTDRRNLEAREAFMKLAELPAERHEAALDEACGDDSTLRRQVQALLQAHAEAQGFMASPTSGANDSARAEA